uniref:Uncharacterized protein n=1 Tax=Anopheles minimus TaxID=112268 RepID=A0A182WN76_9DIPT
MRTHAYCSVRARARTYGAGWKCVRVFMFHVALT